jgi:U3 small nucleolar RNA-associated protein 13
MGQGAGIVTSLAFDESSRFVAGGLSVGSVNCWDVVSNHGTHNFRGHRGVVTLVRFGGGDERHADSLLSKQRQRDGDARRDEMLLFSAGEDGTVRVWDLVTGKARFCLDDHLSVVTAFDFVDANTLVSVSRDKIINFWNLRTGKTSRTVPAYEELESVRAVDTRHLGKRVRRATKSERLVLTGGARGIVRVWDPDTGKCIREQTASAGAIEPITFIDALHGDMDDDDRDSLALPSSSPSAASSSSSLCSAIIAAVGTNLTFVDCHSLRTARLLVGFNDDILDCRYLNDAGTHVAVATNCAQLRIFALRNMTCSAYDRHTDIIMCLAVSPDCSMLATGSKDNLVCVWRIDSGAGRCRYAGECRGHTDSVTALSFVGDDKLLSGSADNSLKLWAVGDAHSAAAMSTRASDDDDDNNNNNNSDSGDSGEFARYRCLSTAPGHAKDINAVAVAPNNRLAASGSHDRSIRIYRVSSSSSSSSASSTSSIALSVAATLKGHKRAVWSLEFSPVDQVLASSSGDNTIRIWSLSDYSCLKTFEGHANSVLKVRFVNAGTQLLSTGSDGLVKLWTIKTAECVNTFDAHGDKIWAFDVRADGRQFVSGGADSLLTVWQDQTDAADALDACAAEERVLFEQQLANAVHTHRYTEAALLALRLERPRQLLQIFSQLFAVAASRGAAVDPLADFIQGLQAGSSNGSDDDDDERRQLVARLFKYVTSWNANSRHSLVAQRVLHSLMSTFTPSQLVAALGKATLQRTLDALLPYSDRHFHRINTLLRKTYLVDLVLSDMHAALTAIDDNDADAQPLSDDDDNLSDDSDAIDE